MLQDRVGRDVCNPLHLGPHRLDVLSHASAEGHSFQLAGDLLTLRLDLKEAVRPTQPSSV